MFENIQISLKQINIYVKTNDNSINVRGQSEDGFIDKSIMLDDDDSEGKVNDLLSEIKAFHAGQLQDTQAALEDQYSNLTQKLSDYFSEG